MTAIQSKYSAETHRVTIPRDLMQAVVFGILRAKGCPQDIASSVTAHLMDADDCAVESHGCWRIIQYADYYDTGYLTADARPRRYQNEKGAWLIDGNNGIGISAMSEATDHLIAETHRHGLAAIALEHTGHTGRLGAFAETSAESGCLCIIIGGGGRKNWRLVTPYGGAKALMSTNPVCIGVPGGERGPVIMDFATSAAAAGWVYGARIAGAQLPDGVLIDKAGNPTRDPNDYFDGGAILPAGGAKGYALAVAAEMIAEAMLGPVTTECNWLMIGLDCSRYRDESSMRTTAEEILAELRECPPAPGFDRVQIPGERERDARQANADGPIVLPAGSWQRIKSIAQQMNLDVRFDV